jgi:4a-hydroxytetrahydrobiopterin dehydratase
MESIFCTDCSIARNAMSEEEAKKMLLILNKEMGLVSWSIQENALVSQIKFKNFVKALHFVNQIGEISEKIKHHPDIAFGWGYCSIKILTHKVNGLTEADFYLASEIGKITF